MNRLRGPWNQHPLLRHTVEVGRLMTGCGYLCFGSEIFARNSFTILPSGHWIFLHQETQFQNIRQIGFLVPCFFPFLDTVHIKWKTCSSFQEKMPKSPHVICSLRFLRRMDSCQPFVSFLIHSFTFLSLFPKICLWKMLVCFLRN